MYKIYPTEGSRLKYTLNIIDTPGFGDTRGIERDGAIIDQIRQLFSSKDGHGVLFIDAVCFIVKAPDARLTVVQHYIFSSIMSLFGKNIEANICTLITFADGGEPAVLASLTESKLPFGKKFKFNNSALFAESELNAQTSFSQMFWEMGCKSFDSFFEHIFQLNTKSLSQTKDVLDEREQLKTIISNILPQVTAGLSKLSELKQQVAIFEKYKNQIAENQNFEYTSEETKQEMIDLPKGQHVTNCIHCNVTCHENCMIAYDDEKNRCWAMDREGNCRICVDKCIWSQHKNTPYIIKYVTETVTKTYADMKKRYENATGLKLTHENYIKELNSDVDEMILKLFKMINEMNSCKTRLKEIALKPDPLSAVEHIDLMIQSEKSEKRPDFANRIQMLEEMKKIALVDKEIGKLEENLKAVRQNMQTVMGSNSPSAKRTRSNVFNRFFSTRKTSVLRLYPEKSRKTIGHIFF